MKKPNITKQQMNKIHPRIPDFYENYLEGRVSRREFLRFATLLGMSATAAACAAPPASTDPNPTVSAGQAASTPAAGGTSAAGGIIRGGTLTSGMELQLIDHPARISWTQSANVLRHVAEYLTETGTDNITRPYLLDRWEASEDVKTWTLYLKKGIKFNNGEELTADDVMFNFQQWLDPDVGSSMLGLLSYLSGMQDVEKVDDYTVRLHLQQGNIGVPEHLFHYPALIVPRTFGGDFIKQAIGTGPFTLEEYAEGERAVLKARSDYWEIGADGKPLPYLDEIVYVSIDKDASVAALQSGQIDTFYMPRPSDWLALKDMPGLKVLSAPTANCYLIRMRADVEPWNDERVRNALKMCQDREKILQLSYYGEGDLSIDAHVAPSHPAYAEKSISKYDPEGAKALLAEAGYPDGLKVTLSTKNDESEPEIAQALKEMAAPAGFDIELDITDPAGYWDRWTEVPFGITPWAHRPLSTMVLSMAYTMNADGSPVPWNETHWSDEEFSTLLGEAEMTLDVEERRKIISDIEDVMEKRGPIGNSYWRNVWVVINDQFEDVEVDPSGYDLFRKAWKKA